MTTKERGGEGVMELVVGMRRWREGVVVGVLIGRGKDNVDV